MTNIDNVKQQATGFLSDQVDRRTTDLGNAVGDHVNNLRSMSDSLRSQGQTPTATLVDAAAERLDQLSTYLRNTDGNSLMHDLETVARKQPMVTATVGLVTGFLAARVLKAGASQRYRSYTEDASTYGTSSDFYSSQGMQSSYGTDSLSSTTGDTASVAYGTSATTGAYGTSGTSGAYGTTGSGTTGSSLGSNSAGMDAP